MGAFRDRAATTQDHAGDQAMIPPTNEVPWYVEIRHISIPEKISLDLARHLPRRSLVGAAVIVTNRPTVMLPVLRKRWMKVIREVERQHSSTLDRTKRESLRQERLHLHQVTFAVNTAYLAAPAGVIFTSPEHLSSLGEYQTLYLLDPLTPEQRQSLVGHLTPRGLIVTYCQETGGI